VNLSNEVPPIFLSGLQGLTLTLKLLGAYSGAYGCEVYLARRLNKHLQVYKIGPDHRYTIESIKS
jgi:hypothetical protein